MRDFTHRWGSFCTVTAATAAMVVLIGFVQTPGEQVLDQPVVVDGPPIAFRPRLVEGDIAPNFSLKAAEGERQVELAQFRGKKPVALVFGSLTCPVFRGHSANLQELYQKYRENVEFLVIYVREAHPVSHAGIHEPYTRENLAEGIDLWQPTNEGLRAQAARQMCKRLSLDMPALVDNMDDTTNRDYTAYPIRLYLVGRDGRIAYRGGRGPTDFAPEELEAAIRQQLGQLVSPPFIS